MAPDSLDSLLSLHADDICALVRAVRTDLDPGTTREELLALAFPPLAWAHRRFDPSRGVSFWSYARHRVCGHLLDERDARTERRDPLFRALRWEADADEVVTPEAAFERAELRARVREALAELPARARIVVHGMYLESRALDDIGAELGLSRSMASRIHTRALGVLRERLAA